MDELWTTLFEAGWAIPATMAGALTSAVGLYLRALGRRRQERLTQLLGERRSLIDLAPGAATVDGRWRNLDSHEGVRGLLEDTAGGPGAVLVELDEDPGFSDGQHVLLSGYVTHREQSTAAPTGYRELGRLWLLDARGPEQLRAASPDLIDHQLRAALRRGRIGAALFASGIALCLTIWIAYARSDGS